MTQRELDIQWIKSYLKDSFKQGKKIVTKKNSKYAIVELTDGREIKLSLPNHILS